MPIALQVSGREGDLVIWRADDRVIADPVGVRRKDVGHTAPGVTPRGQIRERAQLFFAPAARIIQFYARVVADVGEVGGVEKHAVVGQLRPFIAIAKAMGLIANMEGQVQLLTGRQRRFQLINGVEIARRPAHEMERAVELHSGDGLQLVGDVYLLDGLRRLVL